MNLRLSVILCVILAMAWPMQAQNLTVDGNLQVTGTTTLQNKLTTSANDGVLFGGTFGSGNIPATGAAAARFMWYPKKAALRVGGITGTQWDNAFIGDYSVALGKDGIATGYGSVVLASGSVSGGQYSVALSEGFVSEGGRVVAMSGGSIWLGNYSTAMSGGQILGDYSTAMSGGAVYGYYSTAMSGGIASNSGDGYTTAISGGHSLGGYSCAIGRGTYAESYLSTVVGSYGSAAGNATAWVDADPIFVVGNGTGNVNDPPAIKNRNAFTVYKNGNIKIAKRQGDILMGEFGNPGD